MVSSELRPDISRLLTLDACKGVIPPTPACRRALSKVVDALKKQGHEVVDL